MRLFVALEIPDEIRRAIGELIGHLRGVSRGARWVRADGLHITLKFIGEMRDDMIPELERVLRKIQLSSAIEARFHGVGFFPNERHPRVCWIGVEGSPNLAELAAKVDEQTANFGVEAERRAFSPHVTLARFKSDDGLSRLREAVHSAEPLELGAMTTREFQLVRSQLQRGGSVYTRVASFLFDRSMT